MLRPVVGEEIFSAPNMAFRMEEGNGNNASFFFHGHHAKLYLLQKPMQFSKNKHPKVSNAWKKWRENQVVRAFLNHASGMTGHYEALKCLLMTLILEVYKTYHPIAYREAEKLTQKLRQNDPDLWPDGPEPIWPWHAATNNTNSHSTVAYNHRDYNNGVETFCGVQAGGKFGFGQGGQLVLHELHLIVEFQPGQVVLFPSALITHCNIPLKDGDSRFSITLYSPGGLYRYAAYSFRTWEAFKAQDPTGAKAFEDGSKKRWEAYWSELAAMTLQCSSS